MKPNKHLAYYYTLNFLGYLLYFLSSLLYVSMALFIESPGTITLQVPHPADFTLENSDSIEGVLM